MRESIPFIWPRHILWLLLMGVSFAGCSPKRVAITSVADMLTSGSSSLGTQNDPELILDALPFALVTFESLADAAPTHVGLRETLASGFVQYAYAQSDLPAELVKFEDYERHLALRDRARRRYLRGKNWGIDGLSIRHPGFGDALALDPKEALRNTTKEDLALLYWTGAGWLAAISISIDHADLLGQLPQATALLERARELDPDYDDGGLMEIFLALDMSRDAAQGGGLEAAEKDYARALELSQGHRASVFVGYATSVAVKTQNRQTFDASIERALAIDVDQYPKYRLSNILSQSKAKYLQAHVEDLFDSAVESEEAAPDASPAAGP